MNISPPSLTLIPSAAFPASLPELAGVKPGAALIEVPPPVVIGGASIVDLSKLGQLLSASAMLQPRAQAAGSVDAVGEQDADVNLDDGFGKLLAAAQLFVDAFNQFQSDDVNNVQDPLLAPFENVLLLAINQLPGVDSGKSLLSSLEQVGIGFQDAPNLVGSAPLTIDLTALQSAFNANPAQTSALLAQAFQTIGVLAVQLAGQNVDLFASGADVTQPASPFDVLPVALPSSTPAVSPLPAPLAAVDTAAAQAALVDQANDRAENPAVILSAPTGASLALPASPFDVVPNVIASASPAGSLNAVDAALQRSLADQALRNALDANPVPTPTPTPTPAAAAAAVALTVDPVAPVDAQAADAASGADQVTNPIANPVPVPAAVALTVDTVAPTDAQVAGAASEANQIANPIASVGTGSTASNVPAQGQVQAPVTAPLVALDDGRAPLARDPSVAAAVAAYRLGDGALGLSGNKPAAPLSESNTDISAVSRAGSVALDPHDGSSDAWRNEAARNAALVLAENKALAATLSPSQKTVDVTV